MDITDIYETVRARGLSPSKRHFSRHLLGRAANYAADTRLMRCSPGVLLNLFRHLGELGQVDLQSIAFQRLLELEARP